MSTLSTWWIYQRERFPLLANGLLIAVFSLSAVSYSSLLRGHLALPSLGVSLTAFLSCFFFFLQLRIADEHKDYEDDLAYRPYRPVPRGLVTLQALTRMGIASAIIQVLLALWLEPQLLWLLLLAWLYLALMTAEFFVPAWLKARPLTILWTHMLIMPLIDLYATACDWLVAGGFKPSGGLVWFLLISFFNGIVVEIGRKIRAPESEEEGVDTYSALYGTRRAVSLWLGAMLVTTVWAMMAAWQINFVLPVFILLFTLLVLAAILSWRFLQHEVANRAKVFEIISGLWTLGLYLSLGIIPLVMRL